MEIKYLLAFGISLVATLVVMPLLIPFLHKIKFGQSIRKEGPQSHMAKTGTPTMGGLVFVSVPILVMLVLDYKAFFSGEMLICVLAYLGYALIGFIDDFLIVVKKNNDGLKPSVKFLMQSVLAVVFYLFYRSIAETTLILPVVHISLELGILYFVLIFFMFTCESNAVNLTDGIDGLSSSVTFVVALGFLVISGMLSVAPMSILSAALAGGCLGFLFWNIHPAKVFMGDTGSMFLGGMVVSLGFGVNFPLVLVFAGILYIIEALSVVIQVTSFKLTGKRVFKMSPIHHHFEMSGYGENKIVILFSAVALIGVLLSIAAVVML